MKSMLPKPLISSMRRSSDHPLMPEADEIDVFIVDLAVGKILPSGYEALLSPEERERAAGFRFEADRDRYIHMHGILRILLSSRLDMAAESIAFSKNEYGKPYLPGACEFNISYSGDKGLIGLGRVPIGIDIEMVDAKKITPGMIEDVFGAAEREAFFPDRVAPDVGTFFRGWVRKESVIKAMGMGVSFSLKLVQSRLDEESYTVSYEGTEWLTRDLEGCGPGYKAALTIVRTRGLPKIRLQLISP
jgi:phosphopantetheinyl transferase